jgi:K+-sensing histidine kinase KdpD
MKGGLSDTRFLPKERAAPETLQAHIQLLHSNPMIEKLIDCFPEASMILNRERQIVLANDKFAKMLNRSRESLVGLRPGEAVGCIHCHDEQGGCGTSIFCSVCGAANAMDQSLKTGAVNVQECRISCADSQGPFSLDLRVWSTPLALEGKPFMVFAVRDMSDENRRRVLERMFFHDVLNTAGGIRGLLEILPDLPKEEVKETTELAYKSAMDLINVIESQRDLAAAERGELKVKIQAVDVRLLLSNLASLFGYYPFAREKEIEPPRFSGPALIQTDGVLLGRVLGNLLKNALEASSPGQRISLDYKNEGQPTFTVHNQAAMPESVRLQIFQRSFSTKGENHRGIGSYSMKLLTEKYLRGSVSFTSTEEEGTTFTVQLPANTPS